MILDDQLTVVINFLYWGVAAAVGPKRKQYIGPLTFF